MWSRLISLALMLALSTPLSSAPNLPAAPDGYSWERLDQIHASFLLPANWHVKSEANAGTLAYFLTAEKIKKGGRFETGLTINVIRNLKGKDAVAYARAYADEAAKRFEVMRRWDLDVGAFHGHGVITRQPSHDEVPSLVIAYLVVGNERTNTLYLMWFESRESTWEAAWTKGEKMLQGFSLDDEF